MWHSIEQIFSTANLQFGLLIGSGILAISLLVLALTRWGQSSPVWKCVILSFVAHILLMGYAYGTHMIFVTPQLADQRDLLRINLMEDVGDSVADQPPAEAALPPWNEIASPNVLPELDAIIRPEIDSQVVLERVTEHPLSRPETDRVAELPPQLELNFENLELPETLPLDLVKIEKDEVEIETAQIEFKRRDEVAPPISQSPQFDTPPDPTRAEIENDFQPNVQIELPTAPPSPAFVSDLHTNDSELANSLMLPQPASSIPNQDFRTLKTKPLANQLKFVSSPRRLADGQPMPKMYSLRSIENRLAVAQKRGGSIETEQAVNAALRWLADNQEADGRWDASRWGAGNEAQVFGHDRKGAGSDADCGITGLATLSFLAAGHTHFEGPYQDNLKRSLEFLIQQQKMDGNLSGDARLFAKMYCHSMSLLALSEALALTGDQRLGRPVQRGVDFSLAAQNRRDGGWRYQPGDSGDMSQFGWQVLALHSAELGGAVVPRAAFDRMQNFLKQCSSGVGGGLASYRPAQGPSTAMTAEALLCRYLLDKRVPSTTLMEATRRIATERPTPHQVNLYYWYYGTLALYHVGGAEWEAWNSELKNALLTTQVKTGIDAGSWSPDGIWGNYGGRVYSTALATLNLEVYYRYLPMAEVANADQTDRRMPIR